MAVFVAYNTSDPAATAMGYTVLAGNGVLTIAGPQTMYATSIVGSAFSDVAGTLSIQQSFDGINWDVQNTLAVAANTVNTGFNVPIIAPNTQLVYTNGASLQTVFRLFCRTYSVGR